MRFVPALCFFLALVTAVSASPLDDVAVHAAQYERGETSFLQLKVLLVESRDELMRSVERDLVQVNPDDEHFRGWPKEAAERILGEPTRVEQWVWIENLQESRFVVEGQPAWDRVLFDGEKLEVRVRAFPHAIEQGNQLLPFYWIDFDTTLKTSEPDVDVLAELEALRVMFSLYQQTGQGLPDIAKKAVGFERSFHDRDFSAASCEASLSELFKQSLQAEERLIWRGLLYQGADGALWLQVDERQNENWHGLDSWVEVNVNYPYHDVRGVDRESFKTRPASELLALWKQHVAALEQNGPSDSGFARRVSEVNALGNVLSEKANDVADPFTVEQWQAELESAFDAYTTGFSKTLVREKNVHIALLSMNQTRSNSYCQPEHQECGFSDRCENAQCVLDPSRGPPEPEFEPPEFVEPVPPIELPAPVSEPVGSAPTENPSLSPTPSGSPAASPTPSVEPSASPSPSPSASPSPSPSAEPSSLPSPFPSPSPAANLSAPRLFTGFLTLSVPEEPVSCNANQVFNPEFGHCTCSAGFFDCDGDWINGCESTVQCRECQADADCALARCDGDYSTVRFVCRSGEAFQEQVAAAEFGAFCREGVARDEFGAWVSAWGEGFESFDRFKQDAWNETENQWCQQEFESARLERLALQESLNDEFLTWFFSEFVDENARDFESHGRSVHAVFDALQSVNSELARSMGCLKMTELPAEFKPVSVSFDSLGGDVTIWEEVKTDEEFGEGKTPVISPYVKMWFFPPKEEFKKIFTEKVKENFVGPTPSEIQFIRQDEQAMAKIRSIANAFGGDARIVLEVRDGDEVVLRNYNVINERDVMKVSFVDEAPPDAKVTLVIEFDFLYSMMETIIKDLEGARTQGPWWEDQSERPHEFNEDLIPIRMFLGLVAGIFTGDIQVQPVDQLPAVISVISELMQVMPKQ
ncbi:hypothetical protein HY572_00615 [Candidatus Micrarchaeota archaeon]|nr:hypothetical protein [Candidatus Micrarchaeota archaeon]